MKGRGCFPGTLGMLSIDPSVRDLAVSSVENSIEFVGRQQRGKLLTLGAFTVAADAAVVAAAAAD